jgi:hypothetical protein
VIRRRLVTGALLLLLSGAAGEPRLAPAPGVTDPGAALLVGLVLDDRVGTYPGTEFLARLRRDEAESRIPLEKVAAVLRAHEGPDTRFTLRFRGPLELEIPYRILGYAPGVMRATPELALEEFVVGRFPLRLPDGTRRVCTDVRLWAVTAGRMEVDIDGWLDALLGARLDDMEITGLGLARIDGVWHAFSFGRTPRGRGASGAFDLAADEVLVPRGEDMRATGRALRLTMERLRDARPAGPAPATDPH